MKGEPFIIERILNASIEKVWKAITEKEQMQKWYFNIKEFKLEVGFEFRFSAGKDENNQYLHVCKITEIIPYKKLTYSWKYEGYKGLSYVTFELFPEGDKTKVRLKHEGLETFPQDNSDLAKKNFAAGWEMIIGTLLKNFVEE